MGNQVALHLRGIGLNPGLQRCGVQPGEPVQEAALAIRAN
jgi:hypothetical protein